MSVGHIKLPAGFERHAASSPVRFDDSRNLAQRQLTRLKVGALSSIIRYETMHGSVPYIAVQRMAITVVVLLKTFPFRKSRGPSPGICRLTVSGQESRSPKKTLFWLRSCVCCALEESYLQPRCGQALYYVLFGFGYRVQSTPYEVNISLENA